MSINYCIFVYCFVLLLRMIIQVPKSWYWIQNKLPNYRQLEKKGSYANVRLTHPGWASRPELASALESITPAFTDTETPKNWVIYDGIYYLFHYIFLAGWPGPWLGPHVWRWAGHCLYFSQFLLSHQKTLDRLTLGQTRKIFSQYL